MRVGELNALIKLDGKNQFDRDIDGAGRKVSSLGDTALRAGQSMATIGVAAGTAMLGIGAAAIGIPRAVPVLGSTGCLQIGDTSGMSRDTR